MPQEDVPIAFFSYCREDSDFALKLAADLKDAGAHVWIDQLDIEPGTPWDRAVEEALTHSPRMLVVLSPVSVNSDNVRDEVSFALSRQKRVIPVLYRDCDIPFRLARLQHIDFRPDYERALKILVRALGVGQAQAAALASAISAAESAASTAEAEERARQQKLEEDRRRAAEEARLEEARELAAEKTRMEEERRHEAEQALLKKQREAAAEQAARAQQEQQQTEAPARQEQLRREQRMAEQARLEEEAQRAAERARLAQQEQERQAAEIRARQEQLRREQQESVERRRLYLASEPGSEAEPAEPVLLEMEAGWVAEQVDVEQVALPARKVAAAPTHRPVAGSRGLTSPKYLAGAAILAVALGVIVFVLTHRGGPEKAAENKVTESNAGQTAAVPSQSQAPQAQPPADQAPSGSGAPETQPAAPASASKPDDSGEKTKPAATNTKDLAKAKNPSRPPAELSKLSVDNTRLNAANAASTSNTAKSGAPDRVRVSQDVSHGLLIHQVKPVYPPLARSARVQGQVVLNVVIAKDGAVKTITAQTGHPMLIPAAIDAVKQWRYKPYYLNGQRVEVETQVLVNFTLTN